jgi:hypothetical protein
MDKPRKEKNSVLAEKSQRKKSHVRCIGRWEDNINTDLREVKRESTQWTRLAQNNVQFLETVNNAKDLDYKKGNNIFDKLINYQISRMTLYNHRVS